MAVISPPLSAHAGFLSRLVAFAVDLVVLAVAIYGGFLWVLVDPERRTLHDRLARTVVLYTPQPPQGSGRLAGARKPLGDPEEQHRHSECRFHAA